MKYQYYSYFLLLAVLAPTRAFPCDLCAVHNLLSIDEGEVGSWSLGLSEQLSSYGKIQRSDHELENPSEQYLRSSVTQLTLGYKPFERVGFQLSSPIIYRRFRRVESGEKEDGSESGLGDMSFLARFQPYRHEADDLTVSLTVLGGVKLPTGDASRLGEHGHEHDSVGGTADEISDVDMSTDSDVEIGDEHDNHLHEDEGHDHAVMHGGETHDAGEVSAIHGHDLALGSGSFDLISGVSGFARYKRAFISGNLQYTLRSEGSYNYRFGDDLQWSFGPGAYVMLNDERIVMLRAAFSGEAKGRDVQEGNKENDTGMINYFAGPEASLILSGRLRVDAGVDIPIEIKNTGTQAVADYRIRGVVSYRF